MYYFITNREIIIDDQGNETLREDGKENAGDNMRFGKYHFDEKRFELYPEPQSDMDLVLTSNPSGGVSDLKGSTRFFRELYDEMSIDDPTITNNYGKSKTDVLLFIHGFNTDVDGVRSAFQNLHDRYIANPDSPVKHIIVFTWPGRSPAVPYHYHDDRKDAIRSGEVLGRGFDKVVKFFQTFLVKAGNQPCDRKIHMMVHSMGNRVLKHMMDELTFRAELFCEILLIAADIEYDIFEPDAEFNDLIDLGSRVHVYYHLKDRVLDISKWTKNFSNRLGRYGRKRLDGTLIDVYDVDVTDTKDDSSYGIQENALNHWYYYTSTQAVNDMVKVLNGEDSDYI